MTAAPGRITDRATFLALRASRHRVKHGALRLTWVDHGPPPVRIGYAVGTHVGNAVVRNRVRRRLRAVFASLAGEGDGQREGEGVGPLLPGRGALLVSADARVATMAAPALREMVISALRDLDVAADEAVTDGAGGGKTPLGVREEAD